MWGSLLDTCTACERLKRAAGQNKERRGVPDQIDAQAPVISMRASRSCRAQCNMLTTASRISESLVGRSCLALWLWCRFFFFFGFGGAWPVTGMSFGKAGGASKTTPTCAKFSDVEALVVALEKSGRAISSPATFLR